MNKIIKILLPVLLIVSFSGSVLYYFDLLPFTKKTKVENIENNFPKQTTKEVTPGFSSSCVILDEQYCNDGKPIYENSQLIAVGFKLPTGSKVYSPFKGKMEKNTALQLNDKAYPSVELMDISKDDWGLSPERTYFSAVGYFQQGEIATETLEEKQLIITVGDITIDSSLGDYNLILNFKKYNLEKNEWSNDTNLLEQYFIPEQ